MKRKTGILGVLIAILLVGIGYAAISAVTLTINGSGTVTPSDANFKVVYTAVQEGTISNGLTVTHTPATIGTDGVTTVSFTVSGMTKKDEEVNLTYTIANKSPDLSANLANPAISITGTNASEYFEVTSANTASTLAAGATTTQSVKVKVLKTPVSDAVSGTFTITVQATPAN